MMTDSEQQEMIHALSHQWHTLLSKIHRESLFDYGLFKSTYPDTLKLLRYFSCKAALPKTHMDLFCSAYRFATDPATGISAEHDAAGELTGMMLQSCCFDCSDKMIDTWTDYDGQKYAFTDVAASVTALAKQYENDYI